MIILTARFGRMVREESRVLQEFKDVQGIELDRHWEDPEDTCQQSLQKDLEKHAPAGEGWELWAYANVTPKETNSNG